MHLVAGTQEITMLLKESTRMLLNAINKRLEEQDKTNAHLFEIIQKLSFKIFGHGTADGHTIWTNGIKL